MRVLVVKSDFKDHSRGSVISDETEIAEILKSPNRIHVVAADHAIDKLEPAPLPTAEIEHEHTPE
jgi:hypothetical protein